MSVQASIPDGYIIRQASNEDSADVQKMVHAVLKEYGMEPDPEHADRNLVNIEASFQGGILELLYNADGELVGSVGIQKNSSRECELTKMFLIKKERGTGLGRFLLERAITFARDNGFAYIELETDVSLKEALSLYNRYNFIVVEKENSVSRCNIVMRLTLS